MLNKSNALIYNNNNNIQININSNIYKVALLAGRGLSCWVGEKRTTEEKEVDDDCAAGWYDGWAAGWERGDDGEYYCNLVDSSNIVV